MEEEAGLLEEEVDEDDEKGIPRRCYVLGFVFAFLVLFFFFTLILWGASHNKHPIVTMSVRFTCNRKQIYSSFEISNIEDDEFARTSYPVFILSMA